MENKKMKLTGKKVILREITMTDAEYFAKWLSDPKINKFLEREKTNLKAEQEWIKSITKKKLPTTFVIEYEENPIGGVQIYSNEKEKSAVFDIFIGDKKHWGKGLGSDTVKLLNEYIFRKLKMHRIHIGVYSYNDRALKMYRKLGFKDEGILREAVYYEGKFYDKNNLGLLDREWKKLLSKQKN